MVEQGTDVYCALPYLCEYVGHRDISDTNVSSLTVTSHLTGKTHPLNGENPTSSNRVMINFEYACMACRYHSMKSIDQFQGNPAFVLRRGLSSNRLQQAYLCPRDADALCIKQAKEGGTPSFRGCHPRGSEATPSLPPGRYSWPELSLLYFILRMN